MRRPSCQTSCPAVHPRDRETSRLSGLRGSCLISNNRKEQHRESVHCASTQVSIPCEREERHCEGLQSGRLQSGECAPQERTSQFCVLFGRESVSVERFDAPPLASGKDCWDGDSRPALRPAAVSRGCDAPQRNAEHMMCLVMWPLHAEKVLSQKSCSAELSNSNSVSIPSLVSCSALSAVAMPCVSTQGRLYSFLIISCFLRAAARSAQAHSSGIQRWLPANAWKVFCSPSICGRQCVGASSESVLLSKLQLTSRNVIKL